MPYNENRDQNYSPFGRRVEPWERKLLEENTPKYLFEWVKEHPAQTAVGVLSAPLIPEGLAGIGVASLLGGLGRSVDKLHPLSDRESDYQTRSGLSNTADIGLNAIGSGLAQGIFGKLLGNVSKEVQPVINFESATSRTGFIPPKSTSEILPIERNAGIVHEIVKEAGPRLPTVQEQITRHSVDDFKEFIPELWKGLTFVPPKALPKGPGFVLPKDGPRFGTPPNPARFLDDMFLK